MHEYDVPIAAICDQIAAASPLNVTPAEIGAYWWRSFRQLCVESHGSAFRAQRTLERLSLQDVLRRFGGDQDADALSATLYEHWAHPSIYDESVDVLSRSGVPICLLCNTRLVAQYGGFGHRIPARTGYRCHSGTDLGRLLTHYAYVGSASLPQV